MLVFLSPQLVALLYERLESESSAADGAASAGVQEGAAHLFEVRYFHANSRCRISSLLLILNTPMFYRYLRICFVVHINIFLCPFDLTLVCLLFIMPLHTTDSPSHVLAAARTFASCHAVKLPSITKLPVYQSRLRLSWLTSSLIIIAAYLSAILPSLTLPARGYVASLQLLALVVRSYTCLKIAIASTYYQVSFDMFHIQIMHCAVLLDMSASHRFSCVHAAVPAAAPRPSL